MRKSILPILFALLMSSFSCALAADPKPSLDSVGDFDKTLPRSIESKFANPSPKVLSMPPFEPLRAAERHIQRHQYEKAIRILNHRLESDPTNEIIIAALSDAHKAFAEALCLRKEFKRATSEYKTALSLMSSILKQRDRMVRGFVLKH